jgi:predicted enzyme related to lactoylglutathione lyase
MTRPLLVAAGLTTALLCSVAATQQSAPAAAVTSPTVPAAAGEFVWHDLVTDDPATARSFYGGLFGWTFEAGDGIDPGYTIIRHEGARIGGIARPAQRASQPRVAHWITYLSVTDVDRVADKFRAGGGAVLRGPLNARKDLRVAVVADAQGAMLGLASRGPHDAVSLPAPAPIHRWLWMEYLARDGAAALAFHRETLGFASEVAEVREHVTYYLLSTDRPRAGLFSGPWQREMSAWLPYVRVADPVALADRVVALGGTVLLAPRADVRNGSLAIILDPNGAPLALQRYPFDTGSTQ